MNHNPSAMMNCSVCGREVARQDLTEAAHVRPSIAALIRENTVGWGEDSLICPDCMQQYRQLYLTRLLADETGELGELEQQVAAALNRNELLTLQYAPDDVDEDLSFGERMADRVASWGGSWAFILTFLLVLLIWMAANSLVLLMRPFDPYPFILLNLVLSCVAALQAPVIMMSQRRQEAKDRRRAENDYQINLKTELKLRQLHEKIDHHLMHQWHRLLEIQRIQVDLLHEMKQG